MSNDSWWTMMKKTDKKFEESPEKRWSSSILGLFLFSTSWLWSLTTHHEQLMIRLDKRAKPWKMLIHFAAETKEEEGKRINFSLLFSDLFQELDGNPLIVKNDHDSKNKPKPDFASVQHIARTCFIQNRGKMRRQEPGNSMPVFKDPSSSSLIYYVCSTMYGALQSKTPETWSSRRLACSWRKPHFIWFIIAVKPETLFSNMMKEDIQARDA